MSLIFWDHYLDLGDLSRKILSYYDNEDEKQEASLIMDGIVHHRLMICILDNLENHHHSEFLEIFSKNPNDENLSNFLANRIKTDIGALINLETEKIKNEILNFFKV